MSALFCLLDFKLFFLFSFSFSSGFPYLFFGFELLSNVLFRAVFFLPSSPFSFATLHLIKQRPFFPTMALSNFPVVYDFFLECRSVIKMAETSQASCVFTLLQQGPATKTGVSLDCLKKRHFTLIKKKKKKKIPSSVCLRFPPGDSGRSDHRGKSCHGGFWKCQDDKERQLIPFCKCLTDTRS